MLKPPLNSPQTTTDHLFAPCPGDAPIFTVRAGMPLDEALTQASEYLRGASAVAKELVENSSTHLRALARNVEHTIEIAKALVDASVAGLAREAVTDEAWIRRAPHPQQED